MLLNLPEVEQVAVKWMVNATTKAAGSKSLLNNNNFIRDQIIRIAIAIQRKNKVMKKKMLKKPLFNLIAVSPLWVSRAIIIEVSTKGMEKMLKTRKMNSDSSDRTRIITHHFKKGKDLDYLIKTQVMLIIIFLICLPPRTNNLNPNKDNLCYYRQILK